MKYSDTMIRFSHLNDNTKSFHLECEERIDAVWLALFINQNTILHNLRGDSSSNSYKENCSIPSVSSAEPMYVNDVSSEVSIAGFFTPQ